MILAKGGIWTNMEDEILKVAVMKYGDNQWPRISSLLASKFFRKSDMQCKARWHQWLHPSIKKTEWTREEDEKLLRAVKITPGQWRTIAGIVGRTTSQCIERYERLLDAACGRDDDLRKLCHGEGERESNPESKPARPDPVDMEGYEVQMISEARARLTNTKGKKAIRKAREKQIEEAKRLASLSKKRELKAGGIDDGDRKRKIKGITIDYSDEILFEKKPPPGFYDVSFESHTVEEPKFPTTIEELEGEKRFDKEARLRKEDAARNKTRRQDVPTAILQANNLNDQETVRKRTKLNLPTPQFLDYQLQHIAKYRPLASSEALTSNHSTKLLT